MKQRMTGVLFLLAAWFMYHVGVHEPLQQMREHAPEIKEWMKVIVFLPMMIGMGLSYLLLGEQMEGRAAGGFAIAAVPLFALGIWWLVWFEHQKEFYGYGGHPHTAQTLIAPVPVSGVIPNPPQHEEAAAGHTTASQLPTEDLHDVIAASSDTGEAHGFLVPRERLRRALPQMQITDPIRVLVKKGDDLFPSGCSRYRVTLQQGGDVMQLPGEPRVLRPYSMNVSYSFNYCLDHTMPTGGYDIQVES